MRRSPIPQKREKPRRKGNPVPRIKPEREEDPEHLDWIRSLPCWACLLDDRRQDFSTEAHHPRTGGKDGPGVGQKAPDKDAIPLCWGHHCGTAPGYISIHIDPIEFRARYGLEAEILEHVLVAWKARMEITP